MYIRGWDRETDGSFPELDPRMDKDESEDKKPWTPATVSGKEDY